MMWFLIDTDGATTLKSRNSHNPLPTIPFRMVHFSLFAMFDHTNKHEYKHSLYSS
jgi:hypothetical protein